MADDQGRYGLLIAMMEPGVIPHGEIDLWYDQEHIPERRATPGFVSGQRFVSEAVNTARLTLSPKYLAIYDVESPDVFSSRPYLALRENMSAETRRILADAAAFRRGFYEQLSPGRSHGPTGAGGLLLVEFDCNPSTQAEVEDWFGGEYVRACTAIPGVKLARRFQALDENPKCLALFHLDSPAVASQPEWNAALDLMRCQLLNPTSRLYQSAGF